MQQAEAPGPAYDETKRKQAGANERFTGQVFTVRADHHNRVYVMILQKPDHTGACWIIIRSSRKIIRCYKEKKSFRVAAGDPYLSYHLSSPL